MKMLSKDEAVVMLERIISDREELPKGFNDQLTVLSVWTGWCRTTRVRIQRVFGTGSNQVAEIEPELDKVQKLSHASYRYNASNQVVQLVNSMIVEISELWEDDPQIPITSEKKPSVEAAQVGTLEPQVFIVHGHDHGTLQSVARFLERLDLTAIILHERPSEGATIIEKLETHGQASFAVILLTPDDVGAVATEPDKLKPRARQNVVLELGYFLGRLGRRRVAALVSKGVELPSDYSGVVYIQLDDQVAWQFHLAKELRAAGLPIKADALLS